MQHSFNFGRVGQAAPTRAAKTGTFRIAILGDFSGRANRGTVEVGADLAKRKPTKLDVDTIDKVIAKFATTLHLKLGGGTVELNAQSIDDLHPDQLYENLEVFAELGALRQRLENGKTFKAAAAEVRSWLESRGETVPEPMRRRSRSSAIRVDAKLDDFAHLIGAPVTEQPVTEIDALLQGLVAPYVVEDDDPDQDALIAAVDRALTGTMRSVLHHPDFQALEAAWRSLDFLVRRIETDAKLQLAVYDVSADEIAADLASTDALESCGLYQMLVEQPALDAAQGALSGLIGCYAFEMTPVHAELLGRMARIAAHARAPFIAGIGPDCITTKVEDLHPLVQESWTALRALPEARFLALTVPRFLLRMPYGAKAEPIDGFEFEEFDAQAGLRAMLWGNGAILAAVLLAETWQQTGAKMLLGKALGLGDMPYTYYYDSDGEQIALPCTERLLTEKRAAHVSGQGFIAVLALKGRPEVRLAGFQSLTGAQIAGFWTPADQLPAQGPTPAEGPAPVAAIVIETPALAVEPMPDADAVPVEAAAQSAAASSGDADLDALLAELGAAEAAPAPAASEDDGMDPELAALLKDL